MLLLGFNVVVSSVVALLGVIAVVVAYDTGSRGDRIQSFTMTGVT